MERRAFLLLASLGTTGVATWNSEVADAALPVVDHARLLAAAQVEPKLGQTAGLADNPSTRLVQQALRSKGIRTTVDGWFGTQTIAAYSEWQKRLGYRGLDANGQPGRTSLQKLGAGRFSLSHQVLIGSRTDSYGGKRVNTRTRRMLEAARKLVSWQLRITQGSYTNSVSASAGTHAGGGAVDISIRGLTATQRWRTVKALRTVGFAAWYRPDSRSFKAHIHALAVGDPDNPNRVARDQIADYYRGLNGLKSHGPDNTPPEYRVPFTWWERYR